ncbi:hypothetical protein GGR58DRAFT_290158 [Xylaria digitata]|nr:hypothetical protein GGR58DRAFT_290158 [Xylaria digitata]
MCFQILEVYASCRCLYLQHAIDKCPDYGRPGHEISKKTIPVGYACSEHTQSSKGRPIPIVSNNVASVSKNATHEPRQIAKRIKNTVPTPPKNTNSDKTPHGFSPAPSTSCEKGVEATQATNSQANEPPTDSYKTWKFKEAFAEYSNFEDSIESRSTIFQASTITTVDENALEALFRGLLNQKGLSNLWPQIIAGQMSRNDVRRIIDRFLLRFAEDLEHLATKLINVENAGLHRIILSSSTFVRRHRAKVVSRICQAHETQQITYHADTDTEDTGAIAIEDAADTDGDPFTFSIAEEFIFGTEPIRYLEANLTAFIRKRQQKRFSPLAKKLRSVASLVAQFLFPASGPAEKRRVNWTCICGCRIIDDYESKNEGAVEEFGHQLKQYNQTTQSYERDNQTVNSNIATQDRWTGAISTTIEWFRKSFTKSKSHGLPSYQQDGNGHSTQLGSCVNSAGPAQANHNFVLLCVPYLRWGLRLHNSEVCRINSDQQFFQLLRQCYFSQRRGTSREVLRIFTKVRALQFVKFEVFRNKLADVRVCPSMPTASNEYAYDPMPPDAIPPIGPNLLMHLFENPDHADVTLFLYNRFPKKLRAQLEACPIKGSSIGWGIEFVEGVDWHIVFVTTCLGFLFCLIFAVAWAATKGDIQGGFGIASFLLAFVVFCSGALHYMI